ncbi:ankyrin repeat domain-containing protein [Brachyspira alvinipulli]|uniref:ankyrin repeat domain-containing protein n=1 Tax=Brachyspira alvinipulli TaxID=84379 RepID=UPI0004800DBC|nr:ankyrin repeat domain-containing protein [Brachyspira alvinipulli]
MKSIFYSIVIIFFTSALTFSNNHFFVAVHKGDINSVSQYLKNGIDINMQDNRKRTALMIAVYKNDINMVKLLVDNNADVNIQDENLNSPFLYAGARGLLDILKLLYKKADTINVLNIYGGNALIPACEKGHLETVRFLLENTNINVNHVNKLSWTALLEVVILGDDSYNYVEIVKLLLKHGADKNIKDNRGNDALYYAKTKGFKNIEKLLAN